MTPQRLRAAKRAGVTIALGLILAPACRPKKSDNGAAELERMKTNAAAFTGRLGRIANEVANATNLSDTPCPPEEISGKHGGAAVPAVAVELSALKHHSEGLGDAGRSAVADLLTAAVFWSLPLRAPETREEAVSALATFEDFQKRYPYLVVLKPVGQDAQPTLKGWAIVYDISTAKRRCEARFQVEPVAGDVKAFEEKTHEAVAQTVVGIGKQLRVQF